MPILPLAVMLDANVLYPATLRDLLLNLTEAGVLASYWSADILDETFRNIALNRPDLAPEQLAGSRRAMERAFEGAEITGYEHHEANLDLPDPNDHHVLAAAIEADADYIVTRNVKDFPVAALDAYDIERRTPDELVCELLDLYGVDRIRAVLRRQAAQKRRPPVTLSELLSRLAGPSQGLPEAMRRLAESTPI